MLEFFGKKGPRSLLACVLAFSVAVGCNEDKNEEAAPDAFGFIHPDEYEKFDLHFNQYFTPDQDPDRYGVFMAVDSRQPISVRQLINIIIRDQASQYGGGVYGHGNRIQHNIDLFNRKMAELVQRVGSESPGIVQIPQIKRRMEIALHGEYGYYVFSRSARTIFDRLLTNRGNAYSNTLLLDIFLRNILGYAYDPQRMVVIFEDGHMLLGEIVPNGAGYELIGYDSVVRGAAVKNYGFVHAITQKLRIVSTNDFLLSEAIGSSLSDRAKFGRNVIRYRGGKYSFNNFTGPQYGIEDLGMNPFAWGTPRYPDYDVRVRELQKINPSVPGGFIRPDMVEEVEGPPRSRPPYALQPTPGYDRRGPIPAPPTDRAQPGPQVGGPMGPGPSAPMGPRPGGPSGPRPEPPPLGRPDQPGPVPPAAQQTHFESMEQQARRFGIQSVTCMIEIEDQEVRPQFGVRAKPHFVELLGQSPVPGARPVTNDRGDGLSAVCRESGRALLNGGLGRSRSILETSRGSHIVILPREGQLKEENVIQILNRAQIRERIRVITQGKDF